MKRSPSADRRNAPCCSVHTETLPRSSLRVHQPGRAKGLLQTPQYHTSYVCHLLAYMSKLATHCRALRLLLVGFRAFIDEASLWPPRMLSYLIPYTPRSCSQTLTSDPLILYFPISLCAWRLRSAACSVGYRHLLPDDQVSSRTSVEKHKLWMHGDTHCAAQG